MGMLEIGCVVFMLGDIIVGCGWSWGWNVFIDWKFCCCFWVNVGCCWVVMKLLICCDGCWNIVCCCWENWVWIGLIWVWGIWVGIGWLELFEKVCCGMVVLNCCVCGMVVLNCCVCGMVVLSCCVWIFGCCVVGVWFFLLMIGKGCVCLGWNFCVWLEFVCWLENDCRVFDIYFGFCEFWIFDEFELLLLMIGWGGNWILGYREGVFNDVWCFFMEWLSLFVDERFSFMFMFDIFNSLLI